MLSGERSSFRHGAAPRPPSVPRPAPAQSALAAAPFPWIRCSARRSTATRLDSRSILSRARVRFPRDGGVVAHGVKSLTGARKMVSLRFLLCTCSRRLPDLGFSCLIGSSLSYLYRISLRSFTSDETKRREIVIGFRESFSQHWGPRKMRRFLASRFPRLYPVNPLRRSQVLPKSVFDGSDEAGHGWRSRGAFASSLVIATTCPTIPRATAAAAPPCPAPFSPSPLWRTRHPFLHFYGSLFVFLKMVNALLAELGR